MITCAPLQSLQPTFSAESPPHSTHAIAAGLKLYVSSEVVEECESCRRACGGHGFLQSAGLSRIYASVLPAVTYEGENYILAQQVCRAAVKSRDVPAKSQTLLQALDSKRKLSLPECTALLELRAKASVAQLRSRMSGSPQTTWSTVSWECMPVAIAVTEASIAEMLVEIVGRLSDEDCLVSGIFELVSAFSYAEERVHALRGSSVVSTSARESSIRPVRVEHHIATSVPEDPRTVCSDCRDASAKAHRTQRCIQVFRLGA